MCKAFLSAAVLVAMACGPALAETRNYDDSPLSSRPSAAERDREDLQKWLRDFDSKYQGSNDAGDFPSQQVNLIPGAMANAAAARSESSQSYSDLNRVIRWEADDFANSDEMKAAVNEMDAAYEAYQAERERVLTKLAEDPVYLSALSLRDEMGDDLTNLHAQPKKDESHILAVASVKLTHASVARDLESAALASDRGVQDARARLVAAGDRITELRADFNRSLRKNDAVQSARMAYQASRTARLAAEGYLEGAIQSANAALDYAYYVHRYDKYKYLSYGRSYYPCYDYPYMVRY